MTQRDGVNDAENDSSPRASPGHRGSCPDGDRIDGGGRFRPGPAAGRPAPRAGRGGQAGQGPARPEGERRDRRGRLPRAGAAGLQLRAGDRQGVGRGLAEAGRDRPSAGRAGGQRRVPRRRGPEDAAALGRDQGPCRGPLGGRARGVRAARGLQRAADRGDHRDQQRLAPPGRGRQGAEQGPRVGPRRPQGPPGRHADLRSAPTPTRSRSWSRRMAGSAPAPRPATTAWPSSRSAAARPMRSS